MSVYPYDPWTTSENDLRANVADLVERAVDSALDLPVFTLLNKSQLSLARHKLLQVVQGPMRHRVEELLEKVKETAKGYGDTKPKSVGAEVVFKHLEWAVQFQVFEEPLYSIEGKKIKADGFEETRRRKNAAYARVRNACLDLLKLIELNPRPTSKGRKRNK